MVGDMNGVKFEKQLLTIDNILPMLSDPKCEFCRIFKSQPGKILYKDDQFFAIHDIDKASAREHVLICTIDHIETAADITDQKVLSQIKLVGTRVMNEVCSYTVAEKTYRFGFHLKPYNSIDHVHLHCFLLPFDSMIKDKIVYGKMLTSVEELKERLSPLPRF